MLKSKITKIASVVAGAAMAFSFALPVSAVTVAELQAQINVLMAQLSALSGTVTTANFTTDLTVGSTGAEVIALQDMLVAKGHLTMPAGVAKGYFGGLTKAAVSAWQAANGITPTAGYFGSKSRAVANVVPVTTTTVTPVPAVITTVGVEGTLTVSASTVSNSTVYSGDTMAPVLVFKVKAVTSDMAIQRVKIDLGTNSKVYSRAFSKIYFIDQSGSVLASSDLNSNTLTKDSDGRFFLTLTGFSSFVAKDTTKVFSVKADVKDFSSTDDSVANFTWKIRLASNGIRGIDGAGIDQYAGSTSISKDIKTAAALADSASITLSTNSATPATHEVIAADGSLNDQVDKETILAFDIQAKKDVLNITKLVATVTKTGGSASVTTVYLYEGNTVLADTTLDGSTATFSDLNYHVAKDTTKTLTLKVDVTGASSAQTTFGATIIATSGLTVENSAGDTVSAKSGSATFEGLLVTNAGPEFSLVGSPSIERTTTIVGNNSTSTATARFTLRIKAVGSAISFGAVGSSTPLVSAASFTPYINGVAGSMFTASTTDFTVPSSGVAENSPVAGSFTLAQDASTDIAITFNLQAGSGTTYGSYSIGLEKINWANEAGVVKSSTFMAGKTNWRTASVVLP